MEKVTYLEFQIAMHGYDVYKRNGSPVYRWELYWSGYDTIGKVSQKFRVELRPKTKLEN